MRRLGSTGRILIGVILLALASTSLAGAGDTTAPGAADAGVTIPNPATPDASVGSGG